MLNYDENLVLKMYVDDKLSVKQISTYIKISSYKVGDILRRNKIIKRSISQAITQLNITKFNKIPFQLKLLLTSVDNDLKITGIMLYWGEGAKTGATIKLANSNPDMIRVFLLFLRNICGVEEKRIKMIIHVYPDQDRLF